MDNIIKYFYNFKFNNIENMDKYLLIDNKYIFKEYIGSIDELKSIIYLLNTNNIKHNRVVLNKDNELISKYNNKEYILMELVDNYNIDTNFIYLETTCTKDISSIWINIVNNFKLLNTYINNYYIGLTETAISLYNKSDDLEGNVRYVLSHFRVYYPNNSINYLDPTKMTVDVVGRDLAEYIKYKFIYNRVDIDLLVKEIDKYNMNDKEINKFISRLLFPSYYYDLITSDKKLDILLDKLQEYEDFIKDLINILSKKYKIIEIDWLKKELYYSSTFITPLSSGSTSFKASYILS